MATTNKKHREGLAKLCRVCGQMLSAAGRSTYSTRNSQSLLGSTFNIEVDHDDPQVHRERYCHRCRGATYHMAKKGGLYRHNRVVFEWSPHTPEDCIVLEENLQTNRLTWHDGAIPSDEIWLKVGGDKGGGSFKMSFQVVNINTPNAPENTFVFAVYEGHDSASNLHICLNQYSNQIEEISKITWRGKAVRVFLFGDYDFLTTMYGLSGAAGRHCCLWCLIKAKELCYEPSERGPMQPRTCESIIDDHHRFRQDGSNLNRAKMFNNAIGLPIFPTIPLTQVCPPGLHISLGIFVRLFNLLEEACTKLDLKVVLATAGAGSYKKYAEAVEKRTQLQEDLQREKNLVDGLDQIGYMISLFFSTPPENNSTYEHLVGVLAQKKARVVELESQIQSTQRVVDEGFMQGDGPFVRGLEDALAEFYVQRQAYYSGAFVGNHVHRTLKPENLRILLRSIEDLAGSQPDIAVKAEAEQIARKFHTAFTLFGNCHRVYNKCIITQEELQLLITSIKDFMRFYRQQFPAASILPKMHMLEEHIIPFIDKWGVGCGLLGEQGAESIHKYFNILERTYCSIPDRLQRLRQKLIEHYLHSSPTLADARPIPTKRRKTE